MKRGLAPFPTGGCSGNVVCVMQAPVGNDATCTRGGLPCATIARAMGLSQKGDEIRVECGTYVGTVDMFDGRSLRGVDKTCVAAQATVASSATLLTMNTTSSVTGMTLTLASSSTSTMTLTGILVNGAAANSARIWDVILNVDNHAAGTAGTSTVIAVHVTGPTTFTYMPTYNLMDRVSITVNSTNSGAKRGVLLDTAANVHIWNSQIVLPKNAGVGTSYEGIETTTSSGASITCHKCFITAPSGQDISQTAGSIVNDATLLLEGTTNNLGFIDKTTVFGAHVIRVDQTFGDPTRCTRGVGECQTITEASLIAGPQDIISVAPARSGCYATGESLSIAIGSCVSLRGDSRHSVCIQTPSPLTANAGFFAVNGCTLPGIQTSVSEITIIATSAGGTSSAVAAIALQGSTGGAQAITIRNVNILVNLTQMGFSFQGTAVGIKPTGTMTTAPAPNVWTLDSVSITLNQNGLAGKMFGIGSTAGAVVALWNARNVNIYAPTNVGGTHAVVGLSTLSAATRILLESCSINVQATSSSVPEISTVNMNSTMLSNTRLTAWQTTLGWIPISPNPTTVTLTWQLLNGTISTDATHFQFLPVFGPAVVASTATPSTNFQQIIGGTSSGNFICSNLKIVSSVAPIGSGLNVFVATAAGATPITTILEVTLASGQLSASNRAAQILVSDSTTPLVLQIAKSSPSLPHAYISASIECGR